MSVAELGRDRSGAWDRSLRASRHNYLRRRPREILAAAAGFGLYMSNNPSSGYQKATMTPTRAAKLDVAIVGAGFAGLYMLHQLRKMGMSALVFEAGAGVGGTWYWNRYPGARCDVESMQYSFSFDDDLQQKWEWKELYASQ